MSLDLDEKYEIIYAHDEAFAYALAGRIVKKPEVSVWMILIPILFIHHAQRIKEYKEGVKSFANGILSAKTKALDKAYRDAADGIELSYGPGDYFPETELTTAHEQTLAQKQIRVIEVMEAHYKALLLTEGDTLGELIRNVYGRSGRYRDYFNRLMRAEKDLNRYLVENVHANDESAAVVSEIEKNSDALREEEISYFFR